MDMQCTVLDARTNNRQAGICALATLGTPHLQRLNYWQGGRAREREREGVRVRWRDGVCDNSHMHALPACSRVSVRLFILFLCIYK